MTNFETHHNSGELLDVVDEFGRPTGEVLPKKTIHAQGLRHRDVHVWITNGRDLLQQQRRHDKAIMPGQWDISIGEHVDHGETYRDGAMRGTSEELGLVRPPERFVQIGMFTSQLAIPGWKEAHNVVGDNFVLLEPDLQIADLTPQAEEVEGLRWMPIDQLEADLASPAYIPGEQHAEQPPALYALGINGLREVIAAAAA
jgi:isopentenyl-diphosphate delta-isomerase